MGKDKKEKKHKKEKHEKHKKQKHEKHKKEKSHKRSRSEPEPSKSKRPRASVSAEAAEAVLRRLISASPKGAEDVRALLSMLDSGEALVLAHIKDASMVQELERLSGSLGLRQHALRDGSVAHSLDDDAGPSLMSRFGGLLEGGGAAAAAAAAAADGDDEAGPALPPDDSSSDSDEEEEEAPAGPSAVAEDEDEEDAGPVAPRVYGVAARPADFAPSVPAGPIGPAMPGGGAGGGGGTEEEEDDDDDIGPSLPDPDAAPVAEAAAPRWWQKAVEAPRAPSPVAPGGAAAARDEWMKAPPTAGGAAAAGLGEGLQSRTFMRKSVEAKPSAQDAAEWTESPAEREARERAAAAGPGAPRAVPMSLAEVAAQAQARGRTAVMSGSSAPSGGEAKKGPAPKTLVEVHQELAEKKKLEAKGKADWEGKHPWRPWNRETDLEVRLGKTKDDTLNDKIMGKIGDRFGGGRKETTFM